MSCLLPLLLGVALAGVWSCTPARTLAPTAADLALVDDAAAARTALEEARTAVRIASGAPVAARIERLVDLGLLLDADSLLAYAPGPRTADLVLAEASLRLAQYRIPEARALVDGVVAADPRNRVAMRLSLRLAEITGDWTATRSVAEELLRRGAHDAAGSAAAAALGREALRAGDGDLALEWASRARAARRPVVDGWLLEASARAWLGDGEGEEAALRGALALDPFAPDARYRYGLTAWRRGGAGGAAAAGEHWWLALQAAPLHLPTHLLLGSFCGLRIPVPTWVARPATAGPGADLTVDSAAAPGASVGGARRSADEAIRRGSTWYRLSAENPSALDSAMVAYREAAAIAPGDPHVHRGIAAILRHRQSSARQGADSVLALARQWPAPHHDPLTTVIPALAEPTLGEAARVLSWRLAELGGYLPLLARLGARVHLADLDAPLASVTGAAALPAPTPLGHCGWTEGRDRLATASIDHARLGATDANAITHLLVHLLHDGILTDEQRRRLRGHYRAAVSNRRHLSDLAAIDEVEYLAAGVEAYRNLEAPAALAGPPLTRAGLLRRDPDLYRFVEELLTDGAAAAAGDTRFLRSNTAELYTQLARDARSGTGAGRGGAERAAILLDSALVHDGGYRPALLEYALVETVRERSDRAEEWLRVAEGIGADDPSTLATRADVLGALPGGSLGGHEGRAALLGRAIALEEDPVLRAGYQSRLRDLHRSAGRLPEAIGSVVEMLREETGDTPRDRSLRLAAEAEMMAMWLQAGHDDESVRFFGERVAADPVDPRSRARYVDALLMSGDSAAARAELEEGERLLALAGVSHPFFNLRVAELALAAGQPAVAVVRVESLLSGTTSLPAAEALRLVRLLIAAGESTEAQRQLAMVPDPSGDAERAAIGFARGRILEWRGDEREAERYYREAVALDPYDATIRAALYNFLWERGRPGEAAQVSAAAASLEIQPGPGFERQLAR